jgi:hypothetical protein
MRLKKKKIYVHPMTIVMISKFNSNIVTFKHHTIYSIMRIWSLCVAPNPKLKPVISNIFLNTMSFGSSPEVYKPGLNLAQIP